ncbi:hypothetical protein GM661_11245 [Iocasia frigidifontis]|uniref:Uncharacterized protein n=2 Tax=Iocasia fonsfrigidae TaxID=2682810 RepID=A0A8A7K9L9_9FIRM|nr:hypothetical protein GM661_11245 [Iocasia fonsfrigidae]
MRRDSMIINFRYHIFTITAIFAALGIGILIGSSFVADQGIVEEQKRIITKIGSDINNIKNKNLSLQDKLVELEKEIEYRQKMEKEILSLLLKDSLKEKKYYMVDQGSISLEFKNELKEILNKAGAWINIIDGPINNDDLEGINKVIYWNCDQIKNEAVEGVQQEKYLFYNQEDLLGLILTLLKEEKT